MSRSCPTMALATRTRPACGRHPHTGIFCFKMTLPPIQDYTRFAAQERGLSFLTLSSYVPVIGGSFPRSSILAAPCSPGMFLSPCLSASVSTPPAIGWSRSGFLHRPASIGLCRHPTRTQRRTPAAPFSGYAHVARRSFPGSNWPGSATPATSDDGALREGRRGRPPRSGATLAGRCPMKKLKEHLQDHLTLRRKCGCKLRVQGGLPAQFARFAEASRVAFVTTQLALHWANQPEEAQPAQWANRLGMVRGLAKYLSAVDPRDEIPPQGLLPHSFRRKTPYHYRDQEVLDLIAEAGVHSATCPSRDVGGLRVANADSTALLHRHDDGLVRWAHLLQPTQQARDGQTETASVRELCLRSLNATDRGFQVLVTCDWDWGGRELGSVDLDAEYGFRSFRLDW